MHNTILTTYANDGQSDGTLGVEQPGTFNMANKVHESSPFIGDMEQICICGEGCLPTLGAGHLDAGILSIFNQLGPAVQVPFPPGCNDLDVRLQAVVAAQRTGRLASWL